MIYILSTDVCFQGFHAFYDFEDLSTPYLDDAISLDGDASENDIDRSAGGKAIFCFQVYKYFLFISFITVPVFKTPLNSF